MSCYDPVMMSTKTSDLPGNTTVLTDNCSQFMCKMDELMNSINRQKLSPHCSATGFENLAHSRRQCLKLLDEIRVWPPSGNWLYPELTLVCNCILVDIAEKEQNGAKSAGVSTNLDYLVCRTLTRVLLFAFKSPVLPYTTHEKDTDIETLMKKVVKTVEDPIARFRLLNILGQLALLCCLCCIYKRQRDGPEKTMVLLVVLNHLITTVGQSVLQEVLPYRQGLIMCKPDIIEDVGGETSLCVGDVTRLVLLSCHMTSEVGSMKCKQWQWLDTFLRCKELIKVKQHLKAMKKLEAELSQTLDPEQKSVLLCQFADCYLQQGCPQLAIQTYKDALQTYRGHHSVFLHLANVYNILELPELELESLNLLVKVLTDKGVKNVLRPLTTEIEAVIISVFQVILDVTLPCAVHLLARCCVKLHRYKEAASHYLRLLHLLDHVEGFTSEMTSDGPLLKTDLREIVVEAVETLALAQQNTECLLLFEEFYPIVSSDDFLSHLSPQSSPDISANNSRIDKTMNNSHHILFSQSQHCESADEMTSSTEHQASCFPFSSTKLQHCSKFETVNGEAALRYLRNLCNLSRKRMISSSGDQHAFPHLCSKEKDVLWSKSLPVRLLVSKADVLVATQGYTDETLGCLTKALDLLMDSTKTSICMPDDNALDSIYPPSSKRCKLMDNDGTDSKPFNIVTRQEQLEESCEPQAPTTWLKFVVNVALRMAQASFQKLLMSSVLNSCHLILQLEPHNAFAHYLKTMALQDQNDQKDMSSKLWLQERGIQCDLSDTNLQSVLEEKQEEVRNAHDKQTTDGKKWWEASDHCLLSLDITCLNNIIHSIQKQSKTS